MSLSLADFLRKAARPRFDPSKHPRGADGRFIRIGGLVSVTGVKGSQRVEGFTADSLISVISASGVRTIVPSSSVRSATPKPTGLTREVGARHVAGLAPARRKWLKRIAADIVTNLFDEDPEGDYWRGVLDGDAAPAQPDTPTPESREPDRTPPPPPPTQAEPSTPVVEPEPPAPEPAAARGERPPPAGPPVVDHEGFIARAKSTPIIPPGHRWEENRYPQYVGKTLGDLPLDFTVPTRDVRALQADDVPAAEWTDVEILQGMTIFSDDAHEKELVKRHGDDVAHAVSISRFTNVRDKYNEIPKQYEAGANDDPRDGFSRVKEQRVGDAFIPGSQVGGVADEARIRGISQEQLIAEENEVVRRLTDPETAKLNVRISSARLKGLLTSGRFKTQFETKKSTGLYDPDTRKRAEQELFGHSYDLDPTKRPVYGYVSDDDEVVWEEGSLNQYGDVRVRLKNDLRERTTVTGEDSLVGFGYDMSLPMPIDAADWRIGRFTTGGSSRPVGRAFATDDGSHKLSGSGNYMEIQVHGGVSLDDVEEIILSVPPDDATVKALKKSGVKWRVEDETEVRLAVTWSVGEGYARADAARAKKRIDEIEAGGELTDQESREFVKQPNGRYEYEPRNAEQAIAQKRAWMEKRLAEAEKLRLRREEYMALHRDGKLQGFRDVRAMSNNALRDWIFELEMREFVNPEAKLEHLSSEASSEGSSRGRRQFEGQGIVFPADSREAKRKWREAAQAVLDRLKAEGVVRGDVDIGNFVR